MITFRAVAKTYPDGTHAVSDIDLTIPAGKLTVFVGPSGCGKTTCLRMINRMVDPTAGAIEIDGMDVRSRRPAELRRGIGYVIQNVGLFPHRTVLDNIATVPMLTGVRRAQARQAARALLDRVGLPASVAGRYPAQLSGGQQQRVGVARALAADPPILLMDEPFSAVDPVVRAQLQDEMVRIQRELDTTVVFVTHDFDEALRLGDLIVVFAPGGRIAQVAEPATLLAAPADDFVADFIGHDRGYRALSFADAGALPTGPVPTVSAEATLAAAGVADRSDVDGHPTGDDGSAAAPPDGLVTERWALLLDADRRPQGWLDRSGIQTGRAPSRHDIRLGGTLIKPGGSLRSALDAALSSPSGSGVAVDDDGRLIGIVSAQDVLAAIERARRNATARDAESPIVGYAGADSAAGGQEDVIAGGADGGTAGGAATIPSGAP